MITEQQAHSVLAAIASATRQPTDEIMEDVWAGLLAPLEPSHVMEVAKMYIEDGKYFPKTSEFLASVKELIRRDELLSIQTNRTQASFRCDGSRWRESATATSRDGSAALEPCPTCNPVLFAELSDATKNRQWHAGLPMERDDLLVVPKEPCEKLHEPAAPRSGVSKMHEAVADDWSQTRRDVM